MADTIQSAGPAFSSSRVVRFADLSEEEKEAFSKYLIESKVQFFKDIDGSYVSNIRLYDPAVIDMAAYQRSKAGGAGGKDSGRRRGGESAADATADAAAAGAEISGYPKFTSLLAPRDSLKPRTRPIAWLMRIIEELYDARYAKDTADLRGEGEDASPGGAVSTPFPVFVAEFFTKRYGLRSLIDQNCWDVVHNVHAARREHLEVEIFARFLEESYDCDDLLFFLYVRSVIQKEVGVSFRSRWNERNAAADSSPKAGGAAGASVNGPAPIHLSLRDCQIVSRVVFGSESDPLYRTFIAMIERHLSADASSTGRRGSAVGGSARGGRSIEAVHFLHLALVEYHETRPGGGGSGGSGGSDGGVDDGASGSASVAGLEAAFASASVAEAPAGEPSTASAAAAAAALRKSPAFFDDLGEAMHRANEAYLDRLLAAGGAGALPAEVRAQIRAEVTQRLEPKVDALLAATIKAVQVGAAGGAMGAAAGSAAPLLGLFLAVILGTSPAATVTAFCDAVLATEEVKKAVEPLVSLLISYANKRLVDAAQ